MSNITVSFSESQAYRHHHRDEDFFTDPPPAAPAQVPAQVIEMPQYRGRFQKGYDPRRAKFNSETGRAAFEAACMAVDEKYPDARCQHNAALSHCLLRVKHPQYFEKRNRRAA